MSAKVILDNARTQLETQKKRTLIEAHDRRFAELKPELEEYTQKKAQEKADAEQALNESYQRAIAEKQAEIEMKASAYASSEAAVLDKQIMQLQSMIDSL